MDPIELSAFYGKISPLGCPTGEYDGIELLTNVVGSYIYSDIYPGTKFGTFLFHLLDATVDVTFFHLEFWDAVAKQPADSVGSFENNNYVTRAGQLLCGCEACRSAADYRD
jgi:hypothetical protein